MRHTAYLTFAFLSLVTLSGTETVRRHDKYCAAQMGTPVYGSRRTSSRFIDVDNRGVNRLQNHQTALNFAARNEPFIESVHFGEYLPLE
eukprot:m.305199 g.305199  ORF g.305199 m.305199 type:complete len:89 (+) comp16446_c4_seq41:303-569(+)